MHIQTKRIYEDPSPDDGMRILVDRLWPRGVSKDDAQLDAWLKEIAPSEDLRRWFDHDIERWEQFRKRYRSELDRKNESIQNLFEVADSGTLTLLYGAKDQNHNNAVVLKEYLAERHP